MTVGAGRSLKDYWIFTLRNDADLLAMLAFLKEPTGDTPLSALHDRGTLEEEGGGGNKRGSPQGGLDGREKRRALQKGRGSGGGSSGSSSELDPDDVPLTRLVKDL